MRPDVADQAFAGLEDAVQVGINVERAAIVAVGAKGDRTRGEVRATHGEASDPGDTFIVGVAIETRHDGIGLGLNDRAGKGQIRIPQRAGGAGCAGEEGGGVLEGNVRVAIRAKKVARAHIRRAEVTHRELIGGAGRGTPVGGGNDGVAEIGGAGLYLEQGVVCHGAARIGHGVTRAGVELQRARAGGGERPYAGAGGRDDAGEPGADGDAIGGSQRRTAVVSAATYHETVGRHGASGVRIEGAARDGDRAAHRGGPVAVEGERAVQLHARRVHRRAAGEDGVVIAGDRAGRGEGRVRGESAAVPRDARGAIDGGGGGDRAGGDDGRASIAIGGSADIEGAAVKGHAARAGDVPGRGQRVPFRGGERDGFRGRHGEAIGGAAERDQLVGRAAAERGLEGGDGGILRDAHRIVEGGGGGSAEAEGAAAEGDAAGAERIEDAVARAGEGAGLHVVSGGGGCADHGQRASALLHDAARAGNRPARDYVARAEEGEQVRAVGDGAVEGEELRGGGELERAAARADGKAAVRRGAAAGVLQPARGRRVAEQDRAGASAERLGRAGVADRRHADHAIQDAINPATKQIALSVFL